MENATEKQIARIQYELRNHPDRDELTQIRSSMISKWDASDVIDMFSQDNPEEAVALIRRVLGEAGDDALNYQLDQAEGK